MFVGYIKDLHYVSTVPHGRNTNALRYLKFKLSETELQHKERLEAKRHRYKENLKNLEKKKVSIRPSLPNVTVSKEQYLSNCYTENLSPLHEQPWAKENIIMILKNLAMTISIY